MQCCSKDKFERIATVNSPKTVQPEPNHNICPSKLSKRELEDVYFALMQSNLDLKRIINNQSEKQKVLTTKLQRLMNTQRVYMGAETKECCAATKALVQEQKNVIQELKRVNDNLKEQVKQLNMKLCSTKQFLKSPTVGVITLQPHPNRHQSHSARSSSGKKNTSSGKQSIADELKKNLTSVSCQYTNNLLALSNRTTATSMDSNDFPIKACDENRCQTLMSELKREIVVMHETLENDHGKYNKHVTSLKQEVDELQSKNAKMNHVKAEQEESLNQTLNENADIKGKLTEAQSRYDELEALLKIEKSKVAELKTQLRATDMANNTIKTVEAQINRDINKPKIPELFPEKYKFLLDKEETENTQSENIRKPVPTFSKNKSPSPKLPQKIRTTINTSTALAEEQESDAYPSTPTKIKKVQDSPKSPFIQTGVNASLKLPQKTQETDNASTSPQQIQKSVDSNSSPNRTRKTKDAFESSFTKKERFASPNQPWRRQEKAKTSDISGKTEITASPKQPRKWLEQAIARKNNKLVNSSTSPIRTNKFETPLEPSFVKKESSAFPKSSWKKQETTKTPAMTEKIKKPAESATSPIEKQSRVVSPKFPRKIQESATAPLKTKKVVDSSMSPIVILLPDDSFRSPLANKKIPASPSKFSQKNYTSTSPDRTQKTADSITIPKEIDEVENYQSSPSKVKETAELPILSQEIQETVVTYELPNKKQKYSEPSSSPTEKDTTENESTVQLTFKKTVNSPRLSEDKSVKTSTLQCEMQNSIHSYSTPIKIMDRNENISPSIINETVNSPTLSAKMKETVDTSISPIEMAKSVDATTSPLEITRTENKLSSEIVVIVDSPTSSRKLQESVDVSTSPVKMPIFKDATTSPMTNRKSEGSGAMLLNVNETVDSPTLSAKSQETVYTSAPPKQTQKTGDTSASLTNTDKIEQSNILPDVKDTVTSPILSAKSLKNDNNAGLPINKIKDLSTSPTKNKDSSTNSLKPIEEFGSPMSNTKSKTQEENILRGAKDYNNIFTTEFKTPQFNMKESLDTSKKSDQKNPKEKAADNKETIDESKESFESCECCECPPMKIVRKSKPKKIINNTSQDQVQSQGERNKPLDNIQVFVPPNEFLTQYSNNGEIKDSGDINISKETKKSNLNSQGEDSKDKDIILNISPEEKTPFRPVDSPDAKKVPFPQKLDDSGFADVNKSVTLTEDEKGVMDANEQLLEKIAHLQAQLESLKLAIPSQYGESSQKPESTNADPESKSVTSEVDSYELTPRKSIARMKYTAKRNEMDFTNGRPDERSLTPERDERQRPFGNKSLLLNDRVTLGVRKSSLTNQPQFIPTQQGLSDESQDFTSQRSTPMTSYAETPRLSGTLAQSMPTTDQSRRVPDVETESYIDKRVSLKLKPELYGDKKTICSTCDLQIDCTTDCTRKGYECSEECKVNKTNKMEGDVQNIQNRYKVSDSLPVDSKRALKDKTSITMKTDKTDLHPEHSKNALALERNFREAQNNQSKVTLHEVDTIRKKTSEGDLIRNAQELEKKTELAHVNSNMAVVRNPWEKDSLHGAQKAPDSRGGQMFTPDHGYPTNGRETNQYAKETPTTLKALVDLKHQYAKKHSDCNRKSKECMIGISHRGLVPDDCSCPTDANTGLCYCVQYTKSNAADASLGAQLLRTSAIQQTTTPQGPSPVQRQKIHAPLAVTGTSMTGATTHDAADITKKNNTELFTANLNNAQSSKGSQYDNKPSNLHELIDSDIWSRHKYYDGIQPSNTSQVIAEPQRLDDAIDSRSITSEQGKSSRKAWSKKIYDETASIMSEKSLSPSHLQLQRPMKLKNQPTASSKPSSDMLNMEQGTSPLDKRIGDLQICEEYVHICNCPKTAHRDVTVFRSCSGTLRFRTVSNAESNFRRCDCHYNKETATSDKTNEKAAMNDSSGANKNKETITIIDMHANFEPITENPKKHQSTSPDNTDREISSMSDLPSEGTTSSRRNKQNIDQNLSKVNKGTDATGKLPGTGAGARSTTPVSTTTPISTSTAVSASAPTSGITPLLTATPLSLSEGEVPLDTDPQNAKPTPEVTSKPANTQTPQHPTNLFNAPDSTTAKVEQALAAISEELARCRHLMQKTPQEKVT